jgi:hypothetical protein
MPVFYRGNFEGREVTDHKRDQGAAVTFRVLLEQTERKAGEQAAKLVGPDPRREVRIFVCPQEFAILGKRAMRRRRPSIWGPEGIANL